MVKVDFNPANITAAPSFVNRPYFFDSIVGSLRTPKSKRSIQSSHLVSTRQGPNGKLSFNAALDYLAIRDKEPALHAALEE